MIFDIWLIAQVQTKGHGFFCMYDIMTWSGIWKLQDTLYTLNSVTRKISAVYAGFAASRTYDSGGTLLPIPSCLILGRHLYTAQPPAAAPGGWTMHPVTWLFETQHSAWCNVCRVWNIYVHCLKCNLIRTAVSESLRIYHWHACHKSQRKNALD